MLKRIRKARRRLSEQLFNPVSNNWKVVVLCFVGATIFWFFNSLGKDYTTRVNYPLEFLYSLEGTTVVGTLPKSIELNVTGGGWTLLQHTVNPRRFPAINVFLESPTTTHFLTRNELRALAAEDVKDFTLNFVLTDTIHFNIQPVAKRTFYLGVDDSLLSLEENHRIVSSFQLTQDTLSIEGPLEIINLLNDTIFIPLLLEGLDENFSETVEIDFLPSPYLHPTTEEVGLSFEVQEFTMVQKEITLTHLGFPSDSSTYVSDTSVSVMYWVPTEGETLFDSIAISATVYFSDIHADDSLIQPKIDVLYSPEPNLQVMADWVPVYRIPNE